MSIYSTAVKKPVTTALCFVAVVIFGLFSLSKLPIDLYPNIETNSIMVLTAYPGASAADIETNVTKLVENSLNTVSNLKRIESNSKENMSIVTLTFEYGTDIEVATNDVRDKLDQVKTGLPDNANSPTLFKFGTEDIPVVILSVTADESMNGLYKILDDQVANPLKRITGVGAVSIGGIPQRQIEVYCDPQKLEAYGLTIEAISSIIAQENLNTPGGSIDMGSNTFSLRVQGEFSDSRQLENIVVSSKENRVVYLRDVARIVDGPQERAQEAYISGKATLGDRFVAKKGGTVMIQKQSGSNSVAISNAVLSKLPELQAALPADVKLGLIVNTSTNIENTISSLQETIMVTFLIVMIVVLVFLGRWRATFIIMLTIPISLIASFTYIFASGGSLNIITLSSLSIAIGMVVDDAIVVLENITNHIERGSDPKQAAIHGTNEVAISVIASTLTMLAVFLPMTMATGIAGVLFKPLGWISAIIMIVSTIGALTLTPMLCSRLLKLDPAKGKIWNLIFRPIEKVLGQLDSAYEAAVRWVVSHRAITIGAMVAMFIGSLSLAKYVSTEFFPTMDNGRIGVNLELPVGTRSEISRELAIKIEKRFNELFPELQASSFTSGNADEDNIWGSIQSNGSHIIAWNMNLVSVSKRSRGLVEICELMRQELKKYPEIKKYNVLAGGSSGGVGGQSSVDVEIYGYDFDSTDKYAALIKSKLEKTAGVATVINSRGDYIPEYQVDFDREKLALNGLNVATASQFLRNRISGSTSSYYREDGEEYDIKVRYAPENRQSIDDIENIIIYNSQGKGVRIRDLGKVVERMTPPTIEHKNRERIIKLNAILSPKGILGEVAASVQNVLKENPAPNGITTAIGGAFEDQQDSFGDLGMLAVLVIILVFIVLAAQFESMVDPFIIILSIPFALTGVLVGLAVTQTAFGMMAFVGFIMLLGIVVKNGIVLIDYTILNRERGLSIRRSVIHAGRSRLRPVLMTTMTTVLGMIPMAIGTGEGAEMWKSMGMTVAWGLAFSTVITLLYVPAMYTIFAKNGVLLRRRALHKAQAKAAQAGGQIEIANGAVKTDLSY